MKKLKNATIGNRWKSEVSRTILNIFRPYNGRDVIKLPFLEELYEKTSVASRAGPNVGCWGCDNPPIFLKQPQLYLIISAKMSFHLQLS